MGEDGEEGEINKVTVTSQKRFNTQKQAWSKRVLFVGLLAAVIIAILDLIVTRQGKWTSIKFESGTYPEDADITALAVDRQTPTTLYAGTRRDGIFKTTNGGENWVAVGPASTNIQNIVLDPQTPNLIYAGASESGIFKTTDGGENWIAVGPASTTVQSIAIDPQAPATLYAGTWGDGIWGGSILKSTDRGANWIKLTKEYYVINTIVIDPQTPTTLYAGAMPDSGRGCSCILKSRDGGQTWNVSEIGGYVYTLAIDPVNPTILYAGVKYKGVFKSTDGGTYWFPSGLGLPAASGVDVISLVIDPVTPNVVYAGTWGGGLDENADGIFQSTNGGKSWHTINNADLRKTDIFALAISASTPAALYAGTSHGLFLWSK